VRPLLPDLGGKGTDQLHVPLAPADYGTMPEREPQEKAPLDPLFKGGETAALARLKHYLWDTDRVATYFETRNGFHGDDYSTKLSPWLAHGCISPRRVWHELQMYEKSRTANKSTYWVVFELLWRDFFRFFSIKHGNRIFQSGGPIQHRPHWVEDEGEHLFKAWAHGRTGVPIVDACMREVKATGFMGNRGRQIVASYLCFELKIDWRKGAKWFEDVLVDYDVASNWGNWAAAANLVGGRPNRFNMEKQSKDYDADGSHCYMWIPELKKVPLQFVHAPWKMPGGTQQSVGCVIGEHYPAPVDKGGPAAAFTPPERSWKGGGKGKAGAQDQRPEKSKRWKGGRS
jgi:deoxyribodipyrimidine photo-lyase